MNQLMELPLSQIQPSPYQARKVFDPEALQSLAASMKSQGLIEPIVVRILDRVPSKDRQRGKTIQTNQNSESSIYELISGERRVRAAKLLGWTTITARVIRVTSESEAAAKGLIENLQREDLNPMEEAEGFKALQDLDPEYWTQEQIAKALGKSQTYVSLSLRLLKMPKPIVDNIRARIFSRSHGVELLRLPTKQMQLEVANEIPGKLTWEETRRLVDYVLRGKIRAKSTTHEAKPMVESDPLAESWSSMLGDPDIAMPGTWSVSYEGAHVWTFRVSGILNPKQAIGRWAAGIAKAFGAEAGTLISKAAKGDVKAQAAIDQQAHAIYDLIKKAHPGGEEGLNRDIAKREAEQQAELERAQRDIEEIERLSR